MHRSDPSSLPPNVLVLPAAWTGFELTIVAGIWLNRVRTLTPLLKRNQNYGTIDNQLLN